jgi:hypothetical protein
MFEALAAAVALDSGICAGTQARDAIQALKMDVLTVQKSLWKLMENYVKDLINQV